jgi:hypothetical protein
MHVVHCPIEIAGQMGTLCKGLHNAGVTATAYNTFHTYLGYRDYIYNVDVYELEYLMHDMLQHFDVFHFHYGATLLQGLSDLPLLQNLGKKMVMHHWGNDVRTHAVASANNPYVYTGDSPPPDKIRETLTNLSQYIQHAIVQDYEVYPYVAPYYEHVHVLPMAFDTHSRTPKYPSVTESCPLVIHAPTNPLFKGTEYIEMAVKKLQDEGVRFRYQRVEKMSNTEAMNLYEKADIVVDQILCGSYGMLAIESMSLGKPVIGYIRDDLRTTFPEIPPIMSANPDQIYDTLKELIRNPVLRNVIGKRGRAYVEKYHSLKAVTRKLIQIYDQL